MLRITVFFNGNQIHSLETDKEVINIGRWNANEIQIDNVGVSKIHAKIKREGDGYLLEDCHSTNGTFVNGERVTSVPLPSGTVVNISKYTLVCEIRELPKTDQFTSQEVPPTIAY